MKATRILFWVTTIILFLFEGVMPLAAWLFAPSSVTAGGIALGYPTYFSHLLVVCKMLGAVILILPKMNRSVKEWVYAGFGINFISASVSHFVVDGFSFDGIMPLIILGILIVSYTTYFKLQAHGKN